MKKIALFILVLVISLTCIIACDKKVEDKGSLTTTKANLNTTAVDGKDTKSTLEQPPQPSTSTSEGTEAKDPSPSELRIMNMGEESVFSKVPEKIFCNEINLTEILVALGLGDKIVAIAGGEFEPEDALPEYKEQIKKLKYAGDYLSLEAVIATGCDFVYSNPTSYTDRYTLEDFNKHNIDVYACRSNYMPDVTVEDVYEDIRNLGKIFKIEDRAEELIASLKKRQSEVLAKHKENAKPVRVLVYDSGEADVLTPGAGLVSDIIKNAGGENIFSDVKKKWSKVSWEEIVSRNPEIILVNVYPRNDESFQAKVDKLKANPILKDIEAVKKNRFVELPMIETFAGIQIINGIERIQEGIQKNVD